MGVPYTFASATTSIPLSQLDANFSTPVTIGTTTVALGNSVTTINALTLTNVTISSGSVTISNVSTTNIAYTGTLTGGTGVISIGTNQFYKKSTGEIGIGTATPSAKLDVVGDVQAGNGTINVKLTNTATDGVVGTVSNHPLNVYVNNTSAIYVATSTGVSIGNTTDAGDNNLLVQGTIIANGGLKNTVATNVAIVSRVTALSDATSVTFNCDTTDIATQANTQATGTLTVNAPTGTPSNGQKLIFRLLSTNVQTFSWNGVFAGSTDLSLPSASSGSSKYDYMGFIYNSTANKWQLLSKIFGF